MVWTLDKTDSAASQPVLSRESRRINKDFGGSAQVLAGKGVTDTCRKPQKLCWVDRRIPHFPRKLLKRNGLRPLLRGPPWEHRALIYVLGEYNLFGDGTNSNFIIFLADLSLGKNWIFKKVMTRDQCHMSRSRR